MKSIRIYILVALACLVSRPAPAALPLTQSTTYLAHSTPAIQAADMNALQVYLAGIYSAVYSVKALVIDGTGGSAVTPTAGTLTISTQFGSEKAVAPFNTTGPAFKSAGPENFMFCGGRCQINGTATLLLCGGVNIQSAVRTGTGEYTIACANAGGHSNRHFAVITPLLSITAPIVVTTETSGAAAGVYTTHFHFFDLASAHIDPDSFSFAAYGG